MVKTIESVRQAFSQQSVGGLDLLEFEDGLVEHLVGRLDWLGDLATAVCIHSRTRA